MNTNEQKGRSLIIIVIILFLTADLINSGLFALIFRGEIGLKSIIFGIKGFFCFLLYTKRLNWIKWVVVVLAVLHAFGAAYVGYKILETEIGGMYFFIPALIDIICVSMLAFSKNIILYLDKKKKP
mgnify:FL=1